MISKDLEGNTYEVTTGDLATWRPSAYGIIIYEDKILLVKENDRFHLPGGGIHLGEDPKLAVVREVQEETGAMVINPTLVDLASSLFSYGAQDDPSNLRHVHALLLYYTCEYVSADPANVHLDDYEQAANLTAEWVKLSELDDIVVGTTVDWRPVVSQAAG